MLLEAFCAIAVRAGPGLCAIPVTAILSVVSILDAEQLEVLFPIRPLLLKRGRAKTGLNPMCNAILANPRLFHVINVFITSNGTFSECS
jgi:hypothetical protein